MRRRPGRSARPALACFAALVLVRVGTAAGQTLRFGRVVRSYERVFDRLPPGATLFVARQEGRASDPAREPAPAGGSDRRAWVFPFGALYGRRLREPGHLAALASIGREVFVPGLFAQPGVQPLVVDPRFAALKALQGDDPVPFGTAAELAALAAGLSAVPGGEGPRYLLVQGSGRHAVPVPAGTDLVAEGKGVRLVRLPSVGLTTKVGS